MHIRRFALRSVLILGAIFFVALTSALAQVSSGTVVGTVLDSSGAAVPKAKVELKNIDTNVATATTTDTSGTYRVGNLVAGTYSITASAAGFSNAVLRVAVESNKIATANLSLEVGTVSTTVEVADAAAVIDTTTATIQNTFDTNMARDLPVSALGLGVANLSLLSAGVSSNGGIGVGEGPSVGGQRPYNNNFMIEGVDANNKSVTGSLVRTVPNDAVSEFSVLQNQESAQYGHSSGGQFNTIFKSGGNAYHGTAYEYLQNRNLNAIDQVEANNTPPGTKPSNPRFDSNRFGGSFGGPIIKNKLFFFADYDYNPVGQSAIPSALSAPTVQGVALLNSIPGLSATNLAIFKKYVPAPTTADPGAFVTVGGVQIPTGTLSFNSPNYQNNQALVITTDYNMSATDQVRGRYIYNRLAQIDNIPNIPAFYSFNNNIYHVASIAEVHNFSPVVTNELRVGFNRFNQPVSVGNFSFPGLDVFPNISLNDLGLDIGPDDNGPQSTIQNTYQLQDNLTWVKGKHTLQFGFDGKRYISPQFFTQRSRGDYIYSTLDLYLRDITPDFLAQRSLGNNTYYGDQYQTYEYAQDTWRVKPNVTLNLGVRYEYTTIPFSENDQVLNSISNAPGFITFAAPKTQKNNWAPRIGLAYSPGKSGTTSIRAGFGMAYDILYDNIGILAPPPQLGTTVDVSGAGTPNFLATGGIKPNASGGGPNCVSVADCRAQTSAFVGPQKLPYSIQWNFGIQHVFAKNYTFEARYLGTKGVHLDMQLRINKLAPVTAANGLPTYLSAPSQATLDSLTQTLTNLKSISNIVPAFNALGFTNGAFVEDSPTGYSTYHGLALQLNRRLSNGLQFQAAYTWSHLIDNSTADFNTTALTPRRPEDFQNLAMDKSTSALDRRHRFTFAAYYDAPWFKGSNWFMKNLIGNWTVSPVYTYESPELATAQSALDSNLNGDSAGDRTIINTNGVPGTGSGVTALKNSGGAIVAYLANNPTAQYIVAGAGAYANAGRNTVPGRPVNNVDLSLFKNFNLTERFKLQFGAQFFNLFNHAQFIPGFTDRIDNPVVLNNGPTVRAYMTPSSPTFNNPEAIYSSNPRLIQLGLKLQF